MIKKYDYNDTVKHRIHANALKFNSNYVATTVEVGSCGTVSIGEQLLLIVVYIATHIIVPVYSTRANNGQVVSW